MNVWLSDELAATVRELLPDVNYSQVLAEGLRERLACRHDELACTTCGRVEHRFEIEDVALGRFYSDVAWELRSLVDRGGTAEGAARVVKSIAERYRVSLASKLPLPRPTRSTRQLRKVAEYLPADRAERRRTLG